MNWKETPWLFANGEFQLKSDLFPHLVFRIIGFRQAGSFTQFICDNEKVSVTYLNISECTLLARHIDDVTDEEICDWAGFNCSAEFCHDLRQTFCEDVERNLLSTVNLLYLLSIGVYPFPWPKDGSVIRKPKTKPENDE